MAVNVEIKPCRGREVETAWQVCQTLDARWPDANGNVLLSSFAIESLRAAGEVAPLLARGLLAEALPRRWRELMEELGCQTLHLSHRRVSERALAAITASGTPVLCYTVNDPSRARQLRALGVTSVISDAPDLVAAALQ
jgi:glycerophosphoryl diester phosphodiesterase